MLGPFAFLKLGPIRCAREAFAIRCAELELHGQAAFAERRVCCEGEAFLELHLGFGGVVDVAELDGAAAGPGHGERHQFVEPTDLAFVEMLMEGVNEGRGLGFFDEGEAGEGSGEAGGDGGFVEGGELEFGQGGVDEVHAGDELLQPMIHERKLEGSGAVGFSEAASAGDGIEVALLRFLLDDVIAVAHELHGGDALVLGIEEVLHGGAEMLREHLGDPRRLHGGGEAEQGLARRCFAQIRGDEIGGVGDHAFADELALALVREIALGLAWGATFGELIDEASHEATQQSFV